MVDVDKSKIRAFETAGDFADWLEVHHETEAELWLKIYKKGTGLTSINWQEAVIEALCWGWIDGIKKSLDAQAFLQRFTPRRKGSNWSQRNREHVERLLQEGRMKEPGLVHVRAAQANGAWDAAYAPSSELLMPADFITAVENNPKARVFYATLNKANLFAIATRLQTAKKPETRQNRFNKILLMLENNQKFH
jgi:uncharacterized protein YdeI (YjbR/CyaY-like superfamily)